ncbi:MAG: sigma-54-dependent transcriptional regulator [Fidelibacterota bacterium]
MKILIADDEESIRDSLSMIISEEGFESDVAKDGQEALKKVTQNNYDLVITDIRMPKIDGMELLQKTLEISPQTFVIIITAYASIDTAIEALRKGAYDYLIKPLDFDDVIIRIKRLAEHRVLALENQILKQEISRKYDFENLIGRSRSMMEVFELIKKVSSTTGNVLIIGKTGTGKELVARAIHFNSPRKAGRFVAINCGAIAENLIESELFGHKKGSFTGAIRDKEGFFKIASGGTLFLDEVADIPLHLQVKLLRAIEEKKVYPVGSTTPESVDVRIIAATNRDLEVKVEEGNFREDLYYRLNVIEIKLPSLSDRKDDIPLLVKHFVTKYSRELSRNVKGVDNETMKILLNYEWKGEVRELENVIERAIILCEGEYITPYDLPANLIKQKEILPTSDRLKEALKVYEREHISDVLKRTQNNKEKAASILGISLSSLYRKIEELKIADEFLVPKE